MSRYIPLDEEEKGFVSSLARKAAIRKKQFVVQPGYVAKSRFYIMKGVFRSFFYDQDANERTLALAVEDWWISDYNSYIYQEPATLFVEALEDSTVIMLDYQDEQQLLEKYPKFEKYFRILSQRALAAIQRRIISMISKPAEERYDEFLRKYPQIANRVPQYALASYLGFSTEYMSKIRKRKAEGPI